MKSVMKYSVALLSSVFMFIAVLLLTLFLLAMVLPAKWQQFEITIGGLTGNIPGIIGLFLGCLAAAYTFKASLNAKTGKLYRKKKESDSVNISEQKEFEESGEL